MTAPTLDPDWLAWSRELQAIAQTGLAFTDSPYDRERYERLRELAARMVARHTDRSIAGLVELFRGESGYATPKIDVRGAVFDTEGRVLLVREAADDNRWTLPGGWVDVHVTPAENVVKEVREESGYEVRVTKLAAAWDRSRHGHPSRFFAACKMFFLCELTGGAPRTSHETSGVGWFAEADLPADFSLERTLPEQLRRMFAHARNMSLPTDFD